jgi:hypothetical protein
MQKLKIRFEDEQRSRQSECFTDEETKKIEQNLKADGISFKPEEMDRVVNVFFLPVHRDFTGAFMSEQDRKNADHNRRYKEAVLNNDKEKIKEISREFTEKILKKLPEPLSPDELLTIKTPEDLEKKFPPERVYELQLKLCMLSNVMKVNHIMPELQTGLNELKSRDKKKYDEVRMKLAALDGAIVDNMLQAFGYVSKQHQDNPEKGREGNKAVIPGLIETYRESINKLMQENGG